MTIAELQEQLRHYAPDAPVKVAAAELDAVYRAARRCQEDTIVLTPRPVHDGTPCVLVPERLWRRLAQALDACTDTQGQYWEEPAC